MTLRDEQIARAYRETESYAETAKRLGVTRQAIERRVLRMKANGVDLPRVKKSRALKGGV